MDDQKVWRLEPALHQILAVEISQRIQGCRQQVSHLVGHQGAAGKNLREVLLRIIHHDEQKVVPSELATARVEQANQVRMRQCGSRPPVCELRLRQRRVGRQYLDRGPDDILCLVFGEKYHAVV